MSVSQPESRWTVRLRAGTAHDSALSIPAAAMVAAGWAVGDDIEISVTPSGALVLARPLPKLAKT